LCKFLFPFFSLSIFAKFPYCSFSTQESTSFAAEVFVEVLEIVRVVMFTLGRRAYILFGSNNTKLLQGRLLVYERSQVPYMNIWHLLLLHIVVAGWLMLDGCCWMVAAGYCTSGWMLLLDAAG